MADKQQAINAPWSNEHFAAFVRAFIQLKPPYWYGTHGHDCSLDLLNRKAAQYPVPKYSHYKSDRMARYREDIAAKRICADCVGLIKAYAWTDAGKGILEAFGTDAKVRQVYCSNGMPDKSANGMYELAVEMGLPHGSIDTIPEIPGIGVCFDKHIGVYLGNGVVGEMRGFKYGGVFTHLNDEDRPWTHWCFLPTIQYGEVSTDIPASDGIVLGSRLLKVRSPLTVGGDVKQLQEHLMDLGYELPGDGADGKYGKETAAAVQNFQSDCDLLADGEYGELTHAALMAALADREDEEPEEEPAEPQKPGAEIPGIPDIPENEEYPLPEVWVEVVSNGGNVNVRTGPGSQYKRITSVRPGTMLKYIAVALNGWFAVEINDQAGWISGDYCVTVYKFPKGENKAIPDISKWQHDIDFDTLCKNVEFVIARGMYGTGKDGNIDHYAAEMQRTGIPFGMYQYSLAATPEEARAEAQAFYALNAHKPRFWVLDVEKSANNAESIAAWVSEMRALGAKKLGCYVANHRYDSYNFDSVRGLFDFIWIPSYGKDDGTKEGSTLPSRRCDLWQYTSRGSLPGIVPFVDLNAVSGCRPVEWFKEE